MMKLLSATALAAALASPAFAVVGAPAATDPGGARRSAVAIMLERGLCTGVLIDRELILTAAHCLARNRVRAIVTLDPSMKPRFLTAAAAVAHPSFRYADKPVNAAGADLALIRLAQPAPGDMTPASIASFGETGDLTLAGFGVGGDGRGAKAGTLREAPLRARAMSWRDTRMIAAIGGSAWEARIGAGGCRGDSGGPVYSGGSSTVVGIVSWSSGPPGSKSSCGGLTMATDVAPHAQWISSAGAALRFRQGGGRAEVNVRRATGGGRPAPTLRDAFPDLARDSGR